METFPAIAAIWTDILNFLGLAWWVEVFTTQPQCTYYFGPFADSSSAMAETTGYVEDLEQESAQGIVAQVIRCKPDQITIEHNPDRTW
jgi:Domain of unknown function (DUF1816)